MISGSITVYGKIDLLTAQKNSKAIGYLPKRYLREKAFETGAFSLFWIRLQLQLENAMGNKE